MNGFIIFIIVIIAFNILSSMGEKQLKQKEKKKNTPWRAGQDGRSSYDGQSQLRTRANSGQTFDARKGGRNAARQAATIASRRIRDSFDSRASNRKDAADMNRSRVGNWGERAGPGFLTLTNIFVLIALLTVGFYIWGIIQGN